MNILKQILYIVRYAIGLALFILFIHNASGKGICNIQSDSTTMAYIFFFIITLAIILEIGFIIARTRSLKIEDNERKIIARAALFLFDSTYIMLAAITAFAMLYSFFPVLNVEDLTCQNALYFSMVTFTTLGYGDILPNDQFKIIAAGEALLGYMTLGLIVGYAGSLFNIEPSKS